MCRKRFRSISQKKISLRRHLCRSVIKLRNTRNDAGLVVVSSHGKSALQHLLIGSVAERVVRLAHCPVLVLRK